MSRGFTEAELIESLLGIYQGAGRLGGALLGPGDDAGILTVPDGRLVTSVDTLTEDQDFRREWPCGYATQGFDVGWKSVAQNLSDINAMGARPTGIVTSVSLPPDLGLDWADSFARGVIAALDALGADDCVILGGDVGRGREISVTTTSFGSLDGGKPVLRSGARAGDVLAVCGTLGTAAAGLAVLEHPVRTGERDGDGFPADWAEDVKELALLQLRPRPLLGAGTQARLAGATAMLDVSDGLLMDAQRLARASGVSVDVEWARLEPFVVPLLGAARVTGEEPQRWVESGGEDFALLAVFPADVVLPEGWLRVGAITEMSQNHDAPHAPDGPGGWDPFLELE